MHKEAIIYRPTKTAMQSGRGKDSRWILEYDPAAPKKPESLMGWTSTSDTLSQVRLKFETLQAAEDYAQGAGLAYTVQQPQERKIKPRNYGDNFKYVETDDQA